MKRKSKREDNGDVISYSILKTWQIPHGTHTTEVGHNQKTVPRYFSDSQLKVRGIDVDDVIMESCICNMPLAVQAPFGVVPHIPSRAPLPLTPPDFANFAPETSCRVARILQPVSSDL